jgi:uncharacterized cupredoxin-like copper-binding protein
MTKAMAPLRSLTTLALLLLLSSVGVSAADPEIQTAGDGCTGELIAVASAEPTQSPDEDTTAEPSDQDGAATACTEPAPALEAEEALEITVEAGDVWFGTRELVIPSKGTTSITLTNKGFAAHNLTVDALDLQVVTPRGMTGTVTLVDPEPGTYEFYCSISGHREAGMVGTLVVS